MKIRICDRIFIAWFSLNNKSLAQEAWHNNQTKKY